MKRNEHIAPLSRDHHLGLLFCWKIKEGLRRKVDTARLMKYVRHFWSAHLQQHFDEEEALLFVLPGDAFCERARQEHRQIAELINSTGSPEKDLALLGELAQQLDNHIRFEERILFPHLETSLSPDLLQNIGDKLHHLHASHPDDHYPDEFWGKAF